jgi:dienelactone hydrolase
MRYSIIVFAIVFLPALAAAEPLPGTQPLTEGGDLASKMVDGIDRFLLRETAESVARRPKAYFRRSLERILGASDSAVVPPVLEVVSEPGRSPVVGRGDGFEAFAIRWLALPGVHGDGLLLVPTEGREPVADVVAIPDADQTPEMICGLVPGVDARSQFARRLAESGCRVVVPTLVDRSDAYSVSRAGQATNQPGREWVYRPAFEVGRHVIGYEVQKVLAAARWLNWQAPAGRFAQASVIGYGEGGMLALYAAALDPRIDAVCVMGYFGPREGMWQEPIYRNVFGFLEEYGDAEVATKIWPRSLVIEACAAPKVDGPPPARDGRRGAAPGRLTTPTVDTVRAELERAKLRAKESAVEPNVHLIVSGDGAGPFGTDDALTAFLNAMPGSPKLASDGKHPVHLREGFDPKPRARRQIEELNDYTQSAVRESEYTRRKFWEKADRASRSTEKWKESTKWYRDYFENDVIGRFDRPLLDPKPRTRKVYDEPKFAGYEVMLDVFPDVFAYGILVVPKDIKEGERRPVVVCQHGLEGRPQDVADPKVDSPYYHRFACQLAERGFVTYAPQNPYIFGDRFRTLQRKANPLGKTLFSIIVPQHRQTTEWLASLPFVDPSRIAFYGLSYGGKTAMRVPPLVDRYCLSICSADFNEWVWKNTSIRSPYSYVPNIEYEIFEWDLGNTFNYAEMAGLICPRPFMVERGHRDGVAPDEMVAYEFAKVKLLYTDLKIPDLARIEFFDGPHSIHGVGTFEFLHERLNWPAAKQ